MDLSKFGVEIALTKYSRKQHLRVNMSFWIIVPCNEGRKMGYIKSSQGLNVF